MRNVVSKMLVGTATVNTNLAQKDPEALTDGQIIAYDYDTGVEIVAATKNIAFAKGTKNLGEPIIAGPIPVAGITSNILNPYKAAVNKVITLTVTAVPTVGKTAIIKVAYHDNLSIIPNQIKQTVIALKADSVNAASTTTWAAAIAAEFNKQANDGNLFVTVTDSTNTVVFTGKTLLTASDYNGIDRPEAVNFEVGYPDDPDYGTYSDAITTALATGQGDPAKIAWMEDQCMGRLGFSDRRMWNNTKKYQTQAVAGETYAVLIITANKEHEGDMQDTMKSSIGAIIAGDGASVANITTDLAVANIVPETVAAG